MDFRRRGRVVVNGWSSAAIPIPEARLKPIIRLLVAIGYLREEGSRYFVGVPVLIEKDKPLVEATLKLSANL